MATKSERSRRLFVAVPAEDDPGEPSLAPSTVPPASISQDRRPVIQRPTTSIYNQQHDGQHDEHHDYFCGNVGGDLANGGRSRSVITHVTSFMQRQATPALPEWLSFFSCCESERHSATNTATATISSSSSDSEGSDQTLLNRAKNATKKRFPGLYIWLAQRMGDSNKLAITLAMIGIECAKYNMLEYAVVPSVNMYSVFWACDFFSALIGFVMSFWFEGRKAGRMIFNPHSIARMLLMSFLFVLATALVAGAVQSGLSEALVRLLGNLYLPFAAVASYFAFSRKYGLLEWLSLSMTVLSIAAFLLLRDRCHYNYCQALHLNSTEVNAIGTMFMVSSTAFSAVASILMERILQKKGSLASKGTANYQYYIFRTQLDIISSCMWFLCGVFLTNHRGIARAVDQSQDPGSPSYIGHGPARSTILEHSHQWFFGSWTKRQYVLVIVLIAQRWCAGYFVKHFSTVSRGILTCLSTILIVLIADFVEHGKFGLSDRLVPSLMIFVIVGLSALIFQTGRLNIKILRRKLLDSHQQEQKRGWVTPMQAAKVLTSRCTTRSHQRGFKELFAPVLAYSVILYYILADSIRTILAKVVQSNRYLVPQTMAMMCTVLSVMFCCAIIFVGLPANPKTGEVPERGWKGVVRAMDMRYVVKFSLCGLLSALSQCMQSTAFALGTSPALVMGLGKVYMPVIAVLSRYILGKTFIWMEWFALIILTCGAVSFSLMQSVGSHQERSRSDDYGMLLIVGSATTSAIMSLVMEKFLKGETEPFIVQKVRFDLGATFFSALLLPGMGFLATLPGNPRADLAFWTYRPGPDYWGCYELAVNYPAGALRGCDQSTGKFMANMTLIGNSTALQHKASQCTCDNGIFLGWGENYMIYVFLFVTIVQSYLVGKLVAMFSSVVRAIADGFPLLIIYFFMDPLASRIPLASFTAAYTSGPMDFPPPDLARDLICLIMPLSAWTFSDANTQMNKTIDKLCALMNEQEGHAENGEEGTNGETEVPDDQRGSPDSESSAEE